MSEKRIDNSASREISQGEVSFEAEFDISQLVSPEEQVNIAALVEESYQKRSLEKAAAVAEATNEVHELIDNQRDTGTSLAEVKVGNETWQVTEQYQDARGNAWVVGADGRQSMKFESVVAESEPAVSGEAKEISSEVQAGAPEVEGEVTKVSVEDSSLDAIAAAEAHLQEVSAQREAERAAAVESNIAPKSDRVQESEEKSEKEDSDEERSKALHQLQREKEKIEGRQNKELRALDEAISIVDDLTRRVQRLPGNKIDSVLHGVIRERLGAIDKSVRFAGKAEVEKNETSKTVDRIVSVEQRNQEVGNPEQALKLHEARRDLHRVANGVAKNHDAIRQVHKMLLNLENDLRDIPPVQAVRVLRRMATNLQEVSDDVRQNSYLPDAIERHMQLLE